MSKYRGDGAIKQAMAAYEELILAGTTMNQHRKVCAETTDCMHCATNHQNWKQKKEAYLVKIREMIG